MPSFVVALFLILNAATAAVNWQPIPGGRSAAVATPSGSQPGFTLMSPESTGVRFGNFVPESRHLTNQILLNGSGVACGDVDGDGWVDFYFCSLSSSNALYRNLGNWQFTNVTGTAGVGVAGLTCTAAVLADLDGDGDLDLVVSTLGQGLHFFFNDGRGKFTAAPQNGVLNRGHGGLSVALADLDGDGDLDLYVANYRTHTLRDEPNTPVEVGMRDGKPYVKRVGNRSIEDPDLTNRFVFSFTMAEGRGLVRMEENGEADELYLNDGKGSFTAVSWTDGRFRDAEGMPLAHPPYDWSQSVLLRDLNGDGFPDIYVCSDFASPDRLWYGDGRGQFRAATPFQLRQTPLASMGVDFADINRDGIDDGIALDMLSREHRLRFSQRALTPVETPQVGVIANRPQYARNCLYLGLGDGAFAEIAQMAGLDAADWAWTPIFLDVDLDGYEDLLVANGFERDNMSVDTLQKLETAKREKKMSSLEQLHLRKMFPRLDTPNCAFRNLGNLRFADVSAEWGFDTHAVSQGMALADLDNDGDLDVVINNFNGVAGIYRNNAPGARVAVRLKGNAPNTRGMGARIKFLGGAVPVQTQEIIAGGRYLSSDDPARVFAAGKSTNMTIEVVWRNGTRSVISNLAPNQICEISEAGAQKPPPPPRPPAVVPLFQDVSALIHHQHADEPFDDFARQPLLMKKLSQLGPGVGWFDLDGDGWDDLIIGSGRGGTLAVFKNDAKGGFTPLDGAPFKELMAQDQTGLVALRGHNGSTVILAGSANYEDGDLKTPVARQFRLGAAKPDDSLPGQPSSTGPLALADIDGDGELDLFVGGRVVPGRYAEPASSLLFRGKDGQFSLDAVNRAVLANIGLVSGAVFSDLDGDGDPDLVLACEWGPLRVFRNDQRKLVEITAALGLDKYIGWWNGVAVGDFNGDGRLDIIASNWGQDTQYEHYRQQPLHMFTAEFAGNGVVAPLLAWVDPKLKSLMPAQPYAMIGKALPSLRDRFPTCDAYAQASLDKIYGNQLLGARHDQCNWLETTVFINRGTNFEARILPLPAQLTPAFAVCVADLNGDGFEDVFLSQNFFMVHTETSRFDNGRGLVLLGDGQGNFQPLPARESGLLIYGEQRGAALSDYDADGRTDLVVSQNGAETKLYQNTSAKPGLRVRLSGPPGNPHGIGAVLRAGDASAWGPAREIHAGAGYFSQDSPVPVMTHARPITRLQVRWPGGKATESPVPAGAREISVNLVGEIKVLR